MGLAARDDLPTLFLANITRCARVRVDAVDGERGIFVNLYFIVFKSSTFLHSTLLRWLSTILIGAPLDIAFTYDKFDLFRRILTNNYAPGFEMSLSRFIYSILDGATSLLLSVLTMVD